MGWKCHFCGGNVVEGQRFTFIPGRGAVHQECLADALSRRRGGDGIALILSNEVLLYSIIRLKEAERVAESGEVKDKINGIRRSVEKLAAELSHLIKEALEEK